MEVERVLRSNYRLPPVEINRVLRSLVLWALDRQGAGADLADMLHLIAATGCSSFSTFDKGLVEATRADSPIDVELLA